MICHATPYTAATMPIKLGSFAVFSSIMGATISPLILMAGVPPLYILLLCLYTNFVQVQLLYVLLHTLLVLLVH